MKHNDIENKSFRIAFRCTAKEYAKLLKSAEKTGQSVNLYARHASLKSNVRIVQETRPDFETRNQLRGIATNINQIAHGLNANQQVSPASIEKALKQLDEFFKKAFLDGS